MAHLAERLSRAIRRPRLWWGMLTLLAVALAWRWALTPAPQPAAAAAAAAAAGEQSVVVTPQPFTATVTLTGTIVPGDAIDLTAPFDGGVTRIDFTYGDRVTAGQVIATLDVADLTLERNEAEGAYLKAMQEADSIARWNSSPDVLRAQRTADLAQRDLADLDRKLAETRTLLNRGLVSRNEYDGLVQQRRASRSQSQAARDDLAAVLRRGGDADRRIAALTLSNAANRLAVLRRQMEQAAIRSPVDGIIVRPPLSGGEQAPATIHVGTRLTRGQLIGSIARSAGLAVAFNLDEMDVNALRVGQPVIAAGAGFAGVALTGRVSSVAGEATSGPGTAGKARFAAMARLDPSPADQADRIRIGMTATVSVTTYENPRALSVPSAAVRGSAPNATVLVRRGRGATQERRITIGRITPQGAEILAGLRAGETVVWTPPPPAVAAPVTPS